MAWRRIGLMIVIVLEQEDGCSVRLGTHRGSLTRCARSRLAPVVEPSPTTALRFAGLASDPSPQAR